MQIIDKSMSYKGILFFIHIFLRNNAWLILGKILHLIHSSFFYYLVNFNLY